MNLPSVRHQSVTGKKVLLRTDYDVPLASEGQVADDTRIENSLPTLKYLLSKKAAVIVISHLDRPGGKTVPGLSLIPVVERLMVMLGKTEVKFSEEVYGEKTKRMALGLKPGEALILENLRFDSGEEANNRQFAQSLARLADSYVNDAFAASHRQHASIVGLPEFLPSAFGFDFLQEINALSKIRENPKRPVVVVLGGVKKSKIEAAKKIVSWADYVLVGGKLIEYDGVPEMVNQQKILGSLTRDGEDITIETVEQFRRVIVKAKTIVWSGPMGAYEDERFDRGTREVARSILASGAYAVVGGGDTEAALTKFGLAEKVDYVSSGGGSMLAFLAKGSLPGIEAIIKTKKTKGLKE